MTEKELLFDPDSFLSNYYPCRVAYRRNIFTSSEACYQSEKFDDWAIKRTFSLLDADESRKVAHRISRLQTPKWDALKYDVMVDILRAKFTQNHDLAKNLLQTNDAILIENTSSWHDNTWGHCLCECCRNLPYKNLLGKALMQVRQELKQGIIEMQDGVINSFWLKTLPTMEKTTFIFEVKNPHGMKTQFGSCTLAEKDEQPERLRAHVLSLSPDSDRMVIVCGGNYYMVRLYPPLDHPIRHMENICGECVFCFADDLDPSYEVLRVNWQKEFAIVTFTDSYNDEFIDRFVPSH